ncbi:hypothetical protein Taro_028331 [Colocasia esculenta]|uniref:Uncharacterized protein n=1 Tax=Colocasia esculenta TaxID=4460 RepID=A0A843VTW6_COLES|nr:hypothetical protein [Colocasia esculenta]
MSQKGKSVAVARVSGTTLTAARGPKYRSYEGLRERFRIGDEYDIVLAKEEESYMVNKPGCLILSLDLLEVGFRLPLPETICVFYIVCKLRGVQGSAEVFRAQFSLASSPLSGESVYYTKHHPNRMQIHFGKKHSNNKDAPEWGFPTRVWTPRKDSYPFLIQDEATASDNLNLASVRNAEDYLMEFQLVQHDAEELAAGRDQEAMENYAEQIAMTPCLVYVNEGVRTPIAEERRPTSPQASEKRPPLIRLKRKSGAKVVSKKCSTACGRRGRGGRGGRTEAVAAAGASSTVAAEQTEAACEAVAAQGSTSGGANEAVREVEVPKGATVPIPPVEVAVEVPTQTVAVGSHEAEHTAETEEGGSRGSSAVAGDQESTAATGATDVVREEVPSVGQTNAADEGQAGSEEDHLPLTQLLKTKAPLQPSASFLEAALDRLQEGPSRDLPPYSNTSHLEVLARCQGQAPGDAPECSEEAQHQSREAELKEEVKNLKDTLRTSELNLAVARAEEEALTNVLSEAKVRGVTEYKAGPIFKEDLEQSEPFASSDDGPRIRAWMECRADDPWERWCRPLRAGPLNIPLRVLRELRASTKGDMIGVGCDRDRQAREDAE